MLFLGVTSDAREKLGGVQNADAAEGLRTLAGSGAHDLERVRRAEAMPRQRPSANSGLIARPSPARPRP
jgi:hypothetical protein